MEVGHIRFEYGESNTNSKVNKSDLAEFNPYQCGQRLFLVKTPKFMKKLFGEDFELPHLRKE